MAVSAPTSRSDISKLREEKKRREEEARRKGQEAEAGQRKPSIGYDPEGKSPEPEQDSPFMAPLKGQEQPLTRDGLLRKMRADSAARQREEVRGKIDDFQQLARGVGGSLLDAAKKGVQGARNEARAAGDSRRRAEESSKNFEEGPFSESGQQARREADALRNFDYKGAGAALSEIGGSLLGGLSGVLPGMPRVDTRSNEQKKSDADGVFNEGYDRRQEAKEVQGELDSLVDDKTYQQYVDNHHPDDGPLMSREEYAYDEAYKFYKDRAKERGDVEILSPEEFVDEMSGTQQSKDGLGRERVGEMVDPDEVMNNTLSFPVRYDNLSPFWDDKLNTSRMRAAGEDLTARHLTHGDGLKLDGELRGYSRAPDEDNAGRIRTIINDNKRKNPNSPIPDGIRAKEKATRVDPYTGLPMVEGAGSRIEGVPGRDGAPSGAQQFTRAVPPEVMMAANELPTAAERDLYIGRNAIDMAALPEDQRERAARDYAESRRKLRERGNMVPAATDPKTGYYVQVDENNEIIRDQVTGESIPILDADGNPRRSEISSARTEDGNIIPGSQDVVFIRSEEALKRGKQRTNFNNRMQDARSGANSLIMSFVSRDPETNKLKFDEEGFEAQYPGSLPPPGPKRTEAISQLTNLIERGRAVQQNRDRLGRRQQESSPTYGPILMRESLQQAETPEEAAMLALYFNRPDIAQFYQQQAMGDRAILAEEQKARAVAETAALRGGGKGGSTDTPRGLADQIDRTVGDAVADGNLNSAIATLASGPNAVMSESAVRDKAFANDAKANPGAAMLKPMHRPLLKEVFESADDGWYMVENWEDEDILNAEQKFSDELSRRFGIKVTEDEDGRKLRQVISNIFQSLWDEIHGPNSGRIFGGKAYPRRPAQETTGVGLPDDEQPGAVPGFSNGLGGF